MHKRQLTVVGIVLITAMILFAAFSFRQQAQDKSQSGQDDEATVVKKGQVTDKEREYSKEYKKLYSYRKSQKLSELKGGKKDVAVIIDIPELIQAQNERAITTTEFLNNLSCKSDAIVVGSVKSKASHLVEDETFVYTEYEFSVKDILKNNLISPIAVNDNIQITRPGGIIKLDNRQIKVEDQSYQPLQKNNEYLLFLRYVPSANGYTVSSLEGDFVLETNSFKTLTQGKLPVELKGSNKLQTLLDDVHDAVSSGCYQNAQGGN